MRKVFGIAGALLAFEVAPRPADACSCGNPGVLLSPADALTEVPVNAVMIASYSWSNEPSVELRDVATQSVVPLTVDIRKPKERDFAVTVLATPAAPLAPHTAYVLSARLGSLPPVTSTFTTGDAVDTTPPEFAGLAAISLETMTYPILNPDGSGCASSCISGGSGHISRIHLDYVPPTTDAVHLALQIRRADDSSYEEIALFQATQYLGSEYCAATSPVLDPGADYCARVVAYDIAGNIAGADTEVCTAALTCAPRAKLGTSGCAPSDECVPMTAEPEPESSGCSTTRAPTWLGLLAFAALLPRGRGRRRGRGDHRG